MNKLLISLLIGIIAGAIDVTPMLAQHHDGYACLSAFVHWVALGVIISYIQLPFPSWIKGIALAVLCCLPIVILVAKTDAGSVIPIIASSVLLGAATGWATGRFAR